MFGKKIDKKFEKQNVMVVGGAGFIGSHLCDALVKDHRVICVDNFLTGAEANIDHLLQNPNFEFVRHDIVEPLQLMDKEKGLEKFRVGWQGVQEIYYLASPTSEVDVKKYTTETLLVNSVGLHNVLEIARANEAKFLYASSDLVYGGAQRGSNIKEDEYGVLDFLKDERGHHTEAKRFGESLVTAYQKYRKLNIRIARIFNTFGPRMKLSDSRLIVDFTRRALNDETIAIYGGAKAEGSYCYISDMVKGLIKFMDEGESLPVNFGQDHGVLLVELAQKIIELTGSNSRIEIVDTMPEGYYPQLVPDISKAKEILNWFPVVLLEEGLSHTIEDLKAARGLVDTTPLSSGATQT